MPTTTPCRDCVSGTISSIAPTGTTSTIHGLPTYIARTKSTPKGLIVFISDAFGWDMTNSRVLADAYAKEGDWLVYLPDFMDGHSASGSLIQTMEALSIPGFSVLKPYHLIKLLINYIPFMFFTRQTIVHPRILSFFQALRRAPDTSDMSIGAAGFCWGGKYSILLAQDKASERIVRPGDDTQKPCPLLDAAYTAHPSLVRIPEDFDAVTVPLSIAVGDLDRSLKPELARRVKGILEKKKDGLHEVVTFPGAKHGFAVRGNVEDEKVRRQAEEAKEQALGWFERWMGPSVADV